METSRATNELRWAPRCRADEALRQLVEGMGESAGIDTPPLSPKTGGPVRVRELLSGIGRSDVGSV
jgi:hypothetical protein